jgi:hypothetical protein
VHGCMRPGVPVCGWLCRMPAEIAAGQDAFAGQGYWVIGLEIRRLRPRWTRLRLAARLPRGALG